MFHGTVSKKESIKNFSRIIISAQSKMLLDLVNNKKDDESRDAVNQRNWQLIIDLVNLEIMIYSRG